MCRHVLKIFNTIIFYVGRRRRCKKIRVCIRKPRLRLRVGMLLTRPRLCVVNNCTFCSWTHVIYAFFAVRRCFSHKYPCKVVCRLKYRRCRISDCRKTVCHKIKIWSYWVGEWTPTNTMYVTIINNTMDYYVIQINSLHFGLVWMVHWPHACGFDQEYIRVAM